MTRNRIRRYLSFSRPVVRQMTVAKSPFVIVPQEVAAVGPAPWQAALYEWAYAKAVAEATPVWPEYYQISHN